MNQPTAKTCSRCGHTKPFDQFQRLSRSSDGHRSACKDCTGKWRQANLERLRADRREQARAWRAAHPEAARADSRERSRARRAANPEAARVISREVMRAWRAANPEAARASSRRHHAAHREQRNAANRESRVRVREQVFDHYGRACACCGRTDRLTIDHVNGGGRQHRRELFGTESSSDRFYRWLIRNRFPEGFQTLCRSCNISKADSPACRLPHAPPIPVSFGRELVEYPPR